MNQRLFVALGLIFAVTLAAYLPALGGGFIWDDDAHITRPELRSPIGLYRIWFDVGATQQYYPLLHSAFWLQHQLWGDAPFGYHALNVLLHATAAALVYANLRTLCIPGALLAALVFAVHPAHVESVAWITEQKNTLSAVFYLSAMFLYLWFDTTRRKSFYGAAFACFLLGLLCKTVTATLPAALLVIFWWQRGRLSWRRDVLPLAPWFALGAVAGLLTAWVERQLIGAHGVDYTQSLVERSLIAGRVPWFYLSKLFWPANLIFIYPRWEIDAGVWWQWLFPVAALGALFALWTYRRRGRAPLAATLFFLGTLFPVLGFLNVYPFRYSFVADHFQYLASLGMIALAAAAVILGLARLPRDWRWVGYAGCLTVVATLATLTWRQSQMYADVVRLYETTIARNPTCWMAHNNLGVALADLDRFDEAIEHYHQALRYRTDDEVEVLTNLGVALAGRGQVHEAIDHYERALQQNPRFAKAHNNLGIALFASGRAAEAIAHYRQALQYADSASAHNNLGAALMSTRKYGEAIDEFQRAVVLQADYSEAYNNRGIALFSTNRVDEAIRSFERAVELDEDNFNAWANLGNGLARAGRPQEAVERFQQSLERAPNASQLHVGLAMSYAALGRRDEAIAAAEKAIELDRAAGQTATVQATEAWLAKFRADSAKSE